MKRNMFIAILKALVFLVLINLLGSLAYFRLDLTEDKRYTLSEAAMATVSEFDTPVIVDVLLDGNLPAEFTRLKQETRQILEEFTSENNNIKFNFVDPLEGSQSESTIAELQSIGLTPANVTVEENGKVSQELLFPWAMVNHNNNTVRVSLLKNRLGASTEQRINNSVQNLEYAFADAFTKLGLTEKKRIAVIKGNGELPDIQMADYLSTLRDYYNIGAITLDSVSSNPQKVLDQLKGFDLALIAKPTQAFSDEEKYVMDQFIVNGGKSVWLIDQVAMELDSLFNEKGSALAFPRDLNLGDFFFKYGLRINTDLVNDFYATQIVLATGEGNSSQYNPLPWVYHPMIISRNDHPVNNKLEALRLQFASSIDTLANANKKTVLYYSSPLSKLEGTPKTISFSILDSPLDRETYNDGNKAVAVLIEGDFGSAFTNRVKPLDLQGTAEKGGPNKMLVVSDGDVIRNQLRNGRPLELGYDKWTNTFYGNKEFLINSVNYMLDDSGLINIRNKQVAIPLLDPEKIRTQKFRWQLMTIGLPLVLVAIFGFGFRYYQKRKYGR
ncbi:gliding motility-associated ABC transporter substrate-binding protein GldG [Poritiphilus flavus]|uniref:Gliding motility-associated ABC transporter substrate-binding protein GldG n=1 Tax=Poritiphilus flavus TaxID=2697053 RepID=A0A6L9EDY7_9FLAO|nr:gliding motility-associated ABC transporter substrate-binding protein GldG [Poritiphilus flavus]NAS12935.1 gliding motility-associated ABC transporter substrate-binding protein GldG [Poritiphilus flavus]